MFIESLAGLNDLLKREGTDITVVAFIITNTRTNNFNVETLRGQSIMKELKATCSQIGKQFLLIITSFLFSNRSSVSYLRILL